MESKRGERDRVVSGGEGNWKGRREGGREGGSAIALGRMWKAALEHEKSSCLYPQEIEGPQYVDLRKRFRSVLLVMILQGAVPQHCRRRLLHLLHRFSLLAASNGEVAKIENEGKEFKGDVTLNNYFF